MVKITRRNGKNFQQHGKNSQKEMKITNNNGKIHQKEW